MMKILLLTLPYQHFSCSRAVLTLNQVLFCIFSLLTHLTKEMFHIICHNAQQLNCRRLLGDSLSWWWATTVNHLGIFILLIFFSFFFLLKQPLSQLTSSCTFMPSDSPLGHHQASWAVQHLGSLRWSVPWDTVSTDLANWSSTSLRLSAAYLISQVLWKWQALCYSYREIQIAHPPKENNMEISPDEDSESRFACKLDKETIMSFISSSTDLTCWQITRLPLSGGPTRGMQSEEVRAVLYS